MSRAVIDLANGQPADSVLADAHAAIAEACQHALRPAVASPLQYGDVSDTPNDPVDVTWPYRSGLSALLTRHYGYRVGPEALFPSAGVSQAFDLLCTLFAKSGDVVLCEDATYFCALQISAATGWTPGRGRLRRARLPRAGRPRAAAGPRCAVYGGGGG